MPTKEEIIHTCQRDAIDAALDALQGLDPDPNTNRDIVARMVINAYKSADAIIRAGWQQLFALSPDDPDAGIGAETSSVVGAAFWAKLTGADLDIDEIDPNCGGSESVLGLVKAFQLLEAAAQLDYLAGPDCSMSGSAAGALAALDRNGEDSEEAE
jgi:hypothetical protein